MTSRTGRYDVVIVGGGINGAGIARDASLRGLSVLLLEQDDFGSGTSSWSSRLIHGGLRYLEHGELGLVYESLRERRILRRTAPHLVKRLRINIPVYDDSTRGMLALRAGMLVYDLLSLKKTLPRHRVLSRSELLRHEPGVRAAGLQGGVQYFDAQVPYAERLVIENVLAAHAAGAEVKNYSPVTGIDVHQRRVRAVQYMDAETGLACEAQATVVVNAAGPWVDRVLATATAAMPQLMGGTKGSHIIVGAFPGAPKDAFYVEAQADARPFFIIPWNGQYLIGTTDSRYAGDPGQASASRAEVLYLLSETNRVFPSAKLQETDIHFTYAGIRPLPYRSAGPESAITRKHILRLHENAKGLWSVVGGKLTTYRSLAEQVTDRIVRAAGIDAARCRTRTDKLPGAADLAAADAELARTGKLPPGERRRLLNLYGSRAAQLIALACRQRPSGEPVDRRSLHEAEVRFAIRREFARHLVDILHRRTMTGLSADLGAAITAETAAVAADELGWDDAEMARQRQRLADHNARLATYSQS